MLYALEPMSEKGPLTQYEDKLKGDILVLEDTLDDIAKEKAAAAERPATPAAESFVETITVSDEDDDDDECSGIPAEVLEGNKYIYKCISRHIPQICRLYVFAMR